MKKLSTLELQSYFEDLFDRLRPFKEEKSCYALFNVTFDTKTINMYPGEFCYSDSKYYYYGGVGDRGAVTSKKYDNLFDLTYAVIEFQTHGLAFDYARKHKDNQKDTRRIAFPKQIELMRIIGEEYAQKLEKEIEEILKEYPYKD